MEVENKYVTLKNYINGNPSESNLEITSTLLSLTIEEGSKDMIVKDLYVVGSKKILLLQEIDAFGIWRVVASGNPGFQKDDLVGGVLGWEEYSIVRPGTIINKITATDFPLSYTIWVS
ncbi:uncharacterized protein A4U43_C01F24560 [Asparagus officinalis]|uniref:Oxidoreductase N-terminal domain-containing protein n=1 Tax=Asparagus officinalis TaxID=4686 RepID=A0A5P1FUC4_ASPOF|nr:uncharacterized protein A4U43_C01F24560 [Asparagus officinalis]